MPERDNEAANRGDGYFPATRWTMIMRVKTGDESTVRRAVEDLCNQYHYPLYCFIRRRGLDHHDAQDALHDFLAKFLRLEAFGAADAEKGRLRSFLAASLHRFLINWRQKQRHRDREISADAEAELAESEGRYQKERLTDEDTPEMIFERKWAQELVRHALRKLGSYYAAEGKQTVFKVLRPVMLSGGSLRGEDGAQLAAAAGLSEGALRVALSRLLKRYRDVLRAEVEQTIGEGEDVEEEIENLKRALASG